MSTRVPPNSFAVALPTGWEVVSPREGIRVSTEVFTDPADLDRARGERGLPTRRLDLLELPVGADGPGIVLRARHAKAMGGVSLEAEAGIGFYSVGGSNDPVSLQAALSGTGEDLAVVDLPAGTALRRTGEHRGRIVRQYLVPVPGTSDQVALLGFASPSLELGGEARGAFEAVAMGFAFEWHDFDDDAELQADVEDWLQGMANQAGSKLEYTTSTGWRGAIEPDQESRPGLSFPASGSAFSSGRITPLGLPQPLSGAVGLLLAAYAVAVVFASSITLFAKAPVLILGATVALVVARSQARKGWVAVGYVALALAGLLFAALTLYGGSG